MSCDLPNLVLQAEDLIHLIVDDAHLMFQILSSKDSTSETIKRRYEIYKEHMINLQELIDSINNELNTNPIQTEVFPDPKIIQDLREERDKIITKVKDKNKILKDIIDRLRHIQATVSTLNGINKFKEI